MHLAFATYAGQPGIIEDEVLLVGYLAARGIGVTPVVWDEPGVDWRQYDAVVIRSTWDYYLKTAAFDAWLDKLAALGCRVLNPVATIQWNKHKKYFNSFAEKGVLLPPYHYCRRHEPANLTAILRENNWTKAVVKPAVSAGAFNTWTTTPETAGNDQQKLDTMLQDGDVFVQVFMNEIVEHGEVSLLFFNKQFSHAVVKNAAPGDFRIQTQYGGTITAVTPEPHTLQQAQHLLNGINEPLLYARADGIMGNDGNFYLMELELIEPRLYMAYGSQANENFFNALRAMLA